MVSHETARLSAVMAFHAAMLSSFYSPVSTEGMRDAWDALDHTLSPFLADLAAGHFPHPGFTLSPSQLTYELGCHIAKVDAWPTSSPFSPLFSFFSSIFFFCWGWGVVLDDVLVIICW